MKALRWTVKAIKWTVGGFVCLCVGLGAISAILAALGLLPPDPKHPEGQSNIAAQAASPMPLAAAPPTPPPFSASTTSSPASADEDVVKPGYTARFLVTKKNGLIFIWNNEDDMARGLRIAFAGGDEAASIELIKPLITCVVKSGARVVVTDEHATSSEVLVIGGKENGCQGRVLNMTLQDTPQ